jgi:hypothetical protein
VALELSTLALINLFSAVQLTEFIIGHRIYLFGSRTTAIGVWASLLVVHYRFLVRSLRGEHGHVRSHRSAMKTRLLLLYPSLSFGLLFAVVLLREVIPRVSG